MASQPKDFAAGEVLTATAMDRLPQGDIAHATPLTASVGPTSGTTELDIITAPAVTLLTADRRLKITLYVRGFTGSVVNDVFIVRIKEGGTTLQEGHLYVKGTNVGDHAGSGSTYEAVVSSPSAASHTYKATMQRNSGTGTLTASAAAASPITLEVEDIGQA